MGASGAGFQGNGISGLGDGMVGRLTVRGGDVLGVCAAVGGGVSAANGGAGGGASGVATGTGFASPLIVAAGGGGAGLDNVRHGGAAGLPDGAPGQLLSPGDEMYVGKGATQSAPGAGGGGGGAAGGASGPSGPGAGGAGRFNGGGGGAGYFGGGGGGGFSGTSIEFGFGGGGGSDFCSPLPALTGCRRIAGEGNWLAAGPSEGHAKVVLHYVVVGGSPKVTIAAPRDGARFVQGQRVAASFTCADVTGGPGIERCVDQAGRPSGAILDNSDSGRFTLSVTATSKNGRTATESATYTVVPANTTLRLTDAAQSARRWRLPGRANRRNRRLPVGTTFGFALNLDAPVTFTFQRRTTGRRSGRRCVRQTRGNRRARACVRYVRAGTLTRAGRTGRNAIRFRGSLSRTRKLRPARYVVTLTATAAGQTATSRRLAFTIVR